MKSFGRLIKVDRRWNWDGKELEPYFYLGDYQVSIDSAEATLRNLQKAIEWTREKCTARRTKSVEYKK